MTCYRDSKSPFKTKDLFLFTFALVLFDFQINCTGQKIISFLSSVLQTNSSTDDEHCVDRVLLQSRGEHVHLVCASNATYCPTTIVHRNRPMSWMFFDRDVSVRPYDRRDFCIITADDISQMLLILLSNHFCRKEKSVLVFPRTESGDPPDLEELFSAAWKIGMSDVVVILPGSLCRVYTYFPIHAVSTPHCPDLTPVLIASWARGSSSFQRHRRNVFSRQEDFEFTPLRSPDSGKA